MDLLGTCGDACRQACQRAEDHRASGDAASITLIVLLMLFLVFDALFACVAIYQAGQRSPRQKGRDVVTSDDVTMVVGGGRR